MIAVDASALCAILLREADAAAINTRLEEAGGGVTHALTLYETVAAVARVSKLSIPDATETVRGFLSETEVELASIGVPETMMALEAFARYGKGRHPAALNMGDCFSYALAKLRGMPLLYQGDDFAQTDLA